MRGLSFVLSLIVMGAVMPHAFAQMRDENVRLSKSSPGDSGGKAAKQTITMNLALKDGQFYLGEIPSQITDESVQAIDQETLLKLGAPILKETMIEAVRKLPAEGGFVRLKDLKEAAALPFEFDIGQMSLIFFPQPSSARAGTSRCRRMAMMFQTINSRRARLSAVISTSMAAPNTPKQQALGNAA